MCVVPLLTLPSPPEGEGSAYPGYQAWVRPPYICSQHSAATFPQSLGRALEDESISRRGCMPSTWPMNEWWGMAMAEELLDALRVSRCHLAWDCEHLLLDLRLLHLW